jgi:NodT family efflux transporter outer membrane factor (OMF) lipoprotein
MLSHLRPLLSAALLFGICGCATGPLPVLEATDVPPAWEQPIAVDVPVWPEPDWWAGFSSAELNDIILAVQRSNLDLAAAEQRIRQADARVRIAGSALLPEIGAGLSGSRSGEIGDASSFGDSFGADFSASYEVDFWGRNRATLQAAQAGSVATRADRETVALTAVSGAANTFFQVLSLRERLEIARLNLENAQQVLEVTRSRVRNGVATPLELSQQLGAIAGQQAVIPQLEQQVLETRAALALLTGRPPEGFDIAGENLEEIVPPNVAPGLPSDLLLRRPDIVAAEADLIAAHADLAAARAALFPSISLTAGGGLSSDTLIGLVRDSAVALSIGAGLSQTIFDAGARQAQSDAAAAAELETLANYRNAVISAFADVEIALGNIANLAEQEIYEIEQTEQAQFAFDIVTARYREGAVDYLTLLDAQRTLYQARDSLGQLKLARLQSVVALFQALGGGWYAEETLLAEN